MKWSDLDERAVVWFLWSLGMFGLALWGFIDLLLHPPF
jgi:hypothetical protein